jgi:hypothetical protein
MLDPFCSRIFEFFGYLNCYFSFFFGCFWDQTRILVWFMVESKLSGRSGWVKKKWVKGLNTLFGLP